MTSFTESQSYSLLFDVLTVSVILGMIALTWKYVENKKYILYVSIPFVLLAGYFMVEKLETRIDQEGISYKMFPAQFVEKRIEWGQIADASVRDHIVYSRTHFEYDVYSINDKYGLYIILKDGSKIILGTKKPAEMKIAIMQSTGGRFVSVNQ